MTAPGTPGAVLPAAGLGQARLENGRFTFAVQASPGEVWLIEFTEDLASPDWKAVELVSGNEATLTLTVPPYGSQGFYRLRAP